ncbi:hypothetical protein ACFL6I_23325 [candidate division KSB1 bacterium]
MECNHYALSNTKGSDEFDCLRVEFNDRINPQEVVDNLAKVLSKETKSHIDIILDPGTEIDPETGHTKKSFFEGGNYPVYELYSPHTGVKARVDCMSRWGETGMTIKVERKVTHRDQLYTTEFKPEDFLKGYAKQAFTETDPIHLQPTLKIVEEK